MFLFRPFSIALVVLGGWLGMQAEAYLAKGRCANAGGVTDERGVCRGAPRP